MKKQIRTFSIVCACSAVIAYGLGQARAETKKDVSDPVLNEIIQNLGPRIPRFVDKHGKDLFVADEPVTRANLLLVLYEYDKSLKIPKKEAVSKQEFDEMKDRLSLLEGSFGKLSRAEETGGRTGAADMTQIINDLVPNMPMLLDDSLNNSKVFLGLRDEVTNLKPQEGSASEVQLQMKSNLEATRFSLRELTKKVDALEKSSGPSAAAQITPAQLDYSLNNSKVFQGLRDQVSHAKPGEAALSDKQVKASLEQAREDLRELSGRVDAMEKYSSRGSGGDTSQQSLNLEKNLSMTRKQLAKLEDRVSDMEKSKDYTEVSTASSSDTQDVKNYTSMLAKVSMGLSMVAALFIAR